MNGDHIPDEINDLIHEQRAATRGLTWNRVKKRYEYGGCPIFFKADSSFYVVTEAIWQEYHDQVTEWELKP